MYVSVENFEKLTKQEKEFVLMYGGTNCILVKFNQDLEDILCDEFGEDTYDEEDVELLGKLSSNNSWYLMYNNDGNYFLCGDDRLVFTDNCFKQTCERIEMLIKQ